MTSDSEVKVQVLLAEYATLREESLGAIGHRMTATNFTFAAMAVILGALLTSDIDVRLVVVALAIGVPQLAKSGLLIWLGEYQRSQRAGRQLRHVEATINAELGQDVMTRESSLASSGTHMSYPYRAVVVLLLGTGWLAGLTALTLAWWAPDDPVLGPRWLSIGAAAVLLLVEVWFLRIFRGHWVHAKTGTLGRVPVDVQASTTLAPSSHQLDERKTPPTQGTTPLAEY